MKEEEINSLKKEYDEKQAWGLATGIDLHFCNSDYIRNAEKIKEFVYKLCDLIQTERFGDCVVVDFGKDPRVTGFSMMQLVETSLISGHFGMPENPYVYLDVFSCKYYDPQVVVAFAAEFFQAKDYNFYYKIRK
jgi:S-adenosylmethionine decarboxylase